MYPQRNRIVPQPFQYYQGQHPFKGYPQRGRLFSSPRQEGYANPFTQKHVQLFQDQQRPSKQSIFRNEQGQIDFKKIGGGVQTAIGIVNQVSPMVKMLGGLFK